MYIIDYNIKLNIGIYFIGLMSIYAIGSYRLAIKCKVGLAESAIYYRQDGGLYKFVCFIIDSKGR